MERGAKPDYAQNNGCESCQAFLMDAWTIMAEVALHYFDWGSDFGKYLTEKYGPGIGEVPGAFESTVLSILGIENDWTP